MGFGMNHRLYPSIGSVTPSTPYTSHSTSARAGRQRPQPPRAALLAVEDHSAVDRRHPQEENPSYHAIAPE
jgi:hypothetical protein